MKRWLWLAGALAAFAAVGMLVWVWRGRLERSQDANILLAAARYGVDPALVKAIVWKESKFNTRALGRAGEIGLMQLREIAAQEWADAEALDSFEHTDCFDPLTNILAGTFYLAKALRRYQATDNPAPYALADYNAGRRNVLRWTTGSAETNSLLFVEQIGFPGTRDYVRSILKRRERYRHLVQRR